MSNPPFLELVICTYNNAFLLEGALAAIAQQQHPDSVDWGVLVVNNNCTDDTPAVIERAQKTGKIPNLRTVTEPTQGLTPARLCGVKQTTAPWIAFVDDDCFLRPDWVAEAVKFAIAHPNCGAFGGRVTLDWELPPPDYFTEFAYSFAEQELGLEAKPVDWLVGAGVVLNRSALTAVGWTEHQLLADRVGKTLVSGGDMEIALRLAAQYELWYVPACQLFHQISAQRISYEYLLQINYRLGISQLFVSSLQWDQSYSALVRTSIRQAWEKTAYTTKRLIYSALEGKPTPENAISLRFWLGYWMGIWQMATMDPRERQCLVGSARTV